MKILLISANECVEPYQVYPLGMSVAARAFQEAGCEVSQADIMLHKLDGIRKLLTENDYDLVGISIRNIDTVNSVCPNADLVKTTLKIADLCRECCSAKILLGGSGFTLLPEVILECSGADYGIIGEGEEAIRQFTEIFRKGETPPRLIRGVPSRQLAPLYDDAILEYHIKYTHTIPIQTKRGCPCNCVYCTYPALEGKKIRQREIDTIVDQIEYYHKKYPDCLFFFVDSIFNDPCGEYKEFLKAMKARCGAVPFNCFITPGGLSDEDIEFLYDSGMLLTEIGIDAASDTTLKGMGKDFTFDQALHCVRKMQELKIRVFSSVMFCGPLETYDTIREGIENLKKLAPSFTGVFSGVRVLPETALYRYAEKQGAIPSDWNGISSLYFFEKGLDQATVHNMLLEAFKDTPGIIYPPNDQDKFLRTVHKIGYLNFREFMGEGQ